MDGSGSREAVMKPVILKVGVALVISATGLILGRFVSRKEGNEVTYSASNQDTSSSPSRRNDGEEGEEETERLDHYKRDILSLKSRFEELQRKEFEMELRFERYCSLKDQEIVLMEHKSMLCLEKSQLDFFQREVSAMEEEYKRGQDLLMVYLKVIGEIQGLRLENGLLEGKAKKLRRRGRKLYRVLNEKSRRIVCMEKEFVRCVDELETKNNVVKELQGEVKDLKDTVNVLQEEKEMVSVEDYRRFLQEYEDMKKDFANEVKEVINLRWSNACLRHEVIRNGTNHGDIGFSPNRDFQELSLEDQMALTVAEDNHPNYDHHETSRRKRLMKKLKKWVEGIEKGKSTKSDDRCFGRHSLTVEPEEEGMFHSRKSCSSV